MEATVKLQLMTTQTPPPLFIYYTDLLNIYSHLTTRTGAWLRYRNIKKELGKEDHQLITVKEFAEYEGVPVEDIVKRIKNQ